MLQLTLRMHAAALTGLVLDWKYVTSIAIRQQPPSGILLGRPASIMEDRYRLHAKLCVRLLAIRCTRKMQGSDYLSFLKRL